MELLIAITILVTLAILLVPLVSDQVDTSREKVTWANMTQLRNVVMGQYRADMRSQADTRNQPDMPTRIGSQLGLPRPGYYGIKTAGRPDKPQLRYLFWNPGPATQTGIPESSVQSFDPVSSLGWRGPYFMSGTGRYKVNTVRGFTTDYGLDDDPAVMDGWNNPIVIVEYPDPNVSGVYHADIRSAGSDGSLMTDDDVVLNLF